MAALVAGCVQEPSDGASRGEALGDFQPGGDLGAIRGTVVDEAGLPLADVQVGIPATSDIARTDETGGFLLVDLEPGTHTLHLAKIGYEGDPHPVTVAAGEISEATITMRAVAAAGHAHVEIIPHVGIFECALATEVWISACSYPYTAVHGALRDAGANLSTVGVPADVQQNIHRFNITIYPGIGQFVGELTWQPVSAASQRMMLLVLCGDYDPVWDECYDGIRYGDGGGWQGTNPVRAVIDGKEFYDEGNGTEKWDLNKGPIWVMNYVGLPWGDPQLAFQQRFEVWDSVFYNSVAPEGYTVLEDQ